MKNRNVIRATGIYLVFFTLIATEHVSGHCYAANILGFDETNLIDLNGNVFAGIVAGCAFTYFTFALRKWRYKTMTAVGFALAAVYLTYFYFFIDYGIEKETLFVPLFLGGGGFGDHLHRFPDVDRTKRTPVSGVPQALTINGFTGAVMGATLGPALIGEWLKHTMAKNATLLSSNMIHVNTDAVPVPLTRLYGMVQTQALVISTKEIYGADRCIGVVAYHSYKLWFPSSRNGVPFAGQ